MSIPVNLWTKYIFQIQKRNNIYDFDFYNNLLPWLSFPTYKCARLSPSHTFFLLDCKDQSFLVIWTARSIESSERMIHRQPRNPRWNWWRRVKFAPLYASGFHQFRGLFRCKQWITVSWTNGFIKSGQLPRKLAALIYCPFKTIYFYPFNNRLRGWHDRFRRFWITDSKYLKKFIASVLYKTRTL